MNVTRLDYAAILVMWCISWYPLLSHDIRVAAARGDSNLHVGSPWLGIKHLLITNLKHIYGGFISKDGYYPTTGAVDKPLACQRVGGNHHSFGGHPKG